MTPATVAQPSDASDPSDTLTLTVDHDPYQHVLDRWIRDGETRDNPSCGVLPQHEPLAQQVRVDLGLPPFIGLVAYRWTKRDRMPLFDRSGEIPETLNEPPGMAQCRKPGVPVPEADWPAVIEATGYTPPAGWKLYVMLPVY